MKKSTLVISVLLLAMLLVSMLGFAPRSAADTTISGAMGAILDSSTDDSVVTITDRRVGGGSIVNKGSATVYINWTGGAVTANDTEGTNKCFLEDGDSVRIPKACTSFSHATASGTAKLIYVEE